MATSCEKAFNIAEVLEMILLALPMKDLLLAQRVCSAWKATITGSLKLQQALYFKAAGRAVRPDKPSVTVFRNPLLDELIGSVCNYYYGVDIDLHWTFLDLHASWEHSAASWRKMLLSQPPVSEVGVYMETYSDGGRRLETATRPILENDGITAGSVMGCAKAALAGRDSEYGGQVAAKCWINNINLREQP